VTAEQYLSSPSLLASLIDHTLLKPDAVQADIGLLCRQARTSSFASVCINPYWIPFASAELAGTSVKVCTVIGFPLGANDPATKIFEAKAALASGAAELDMVINIGALKSGKLDVVEKEITDLADIAHGAGALLKVILETCLLSPEDIVSACQMAARSRADFVKTSTGFSTGGATEAYVALMRQTVGPAMGVKASGGVRSLDALVRMVHAGANRIGTSSGVQILAEYSSGAPQISAGGY
jgi:deoxyribose-phosphate aldolase